MLSRAKAFCLPVSRKASKAEVSLTSYIYFYMNCKRRSGGSFGGKCMVCGFGGFAEARNVNYELITKHFTVN